MTHPFSDASVHTGREGAVPKLWGGREELHGNKRWIQLRGPHDVHLDFLLCPRILENEFCSRFQALASKIMPLAPLTVTVVLSMGLPLVLHVNSGVCEGAWAYRMTNRYGADVKT